MNNGIASEVLAALDERARGSAPVYFAHATVNTDEEAIHFIDGQGLYAEVTIVAPVKLSGVTSKCVVGMFDASGGGLSSRSLKRGDHVLVAFIEGDPNGHSMIIGRISTVDSKPVAEVADRTVDEENLQRSNFDRLPAGENWHIELEDGGFFVDVKGGGRLVIRAPDGGVFCFGPHQTEGGMGWKIRSGHGASIQVSKGIVMRSPNGKNYIEVNDEGIFQNGEIWQADGGGMFLGMSKTDVPTAPTTGVCIGGASGLCAFQSLKVFVGKGV